MKRIFLISFMLLLLGVAYADGPRYRFKSRRALQSLWRKEQTADPSSSLHSKNRKITPREMHGENSSLYGSSSRYGVVPTLPFAESSQSPSGSGTSSTPSTFGGQKSSITFPVYDPTDGGGHIVGKPGSGGSGGNPFTSGNLDEPGQQPYAPPTPPVGDGMPVLLLLTATFIAIKKRLSK